MTLSGRLRKLCALVFAALLALSITAPALGQPAGDGYKSHMENGIKLFQDKNYAAAVTEFRAAYEAHPKASPLVNIALCYKAEFKYPKAIQSLEKALKEHADSMDANDKRAAEDAIKEMRGLLGYVTVKVTPNAGVIQVDGEDAVQVAPPTPPATVSSTLVAVGPGSHKIRARLDGFDGREVEVTVASGTRDKVVSLNLVATKAWVSIQAPGLMIGMDNNPLGRELYSGFIDPGRHVFQMYKPDDKPGPKTGEPRLVTTNSGSATAEAGRPLYVRPGPRGTLLVYPPQSATGSPPPSPMPMPAPPKKIEPPAPPEPQKKGFYVLGGVNIVWPLTHADGGYDANSGWSGQLFGGYRVNNNAGFQVMFEYTNVFSPSSNSDSNPNKGYADSTFRLGGGVRLMTSGKTVRLVGDLNGGLALDRVTFSGGAGDSTINDPSDSKYNAQGFLVGDGGLEIDINGVLLDGLGQLGIQTTRGAGSPSSQFSKPLGEFALGLRVGYAFWK
jgi:hypothetical protein